jgi:DNA-directed RNA polymerase subunit N
MIETCLLVTHGLKRVKSLSGVELEKRGRNHIGDGVIIPIRCFTCGKIIAPLYEDYKRRYEEYRKAIAAGEKPKETPKNILDDLGVERYCCRRMIISQVDLLKEASPYE